MATPPPPPARNIILTFHGIGFTTGKQRKFEAVCGPNKPTPTGGYAQWSELNRPLRDSLTIFQGRGATALSVQVIFGHWSNDGGWLTDDATGQSIENDIAVLEWMAGQGFDVGPSPVVYAWSHASQGGDTLLISQQYANLPWIISDGIQWGKAYTNDNRFRVWQEATFTLKNYLNLSKPPQPSTNDKGGYFVSKPGRDTALLIAGAPDVQSPMVDHRILAERICSDARNNPMKHSGIRLRRKTVSWPIRHGVSVFVPSHQTT